MGSLKKALIVFTVLAVIAASLAGYVRMKGREFDAAGAAEIGSFLNGREIGTTVYTAASLKGLPAPAVRYFRHVLSEGTPLTSLARVRLSGSFLPSPSANFMSFSAEEYFDARRPAYLWYGKIKVSAVLWMMNIERFIDGTASFDRKLVGAFNHVHYEGKGDKSSLVRYLGESLWFPTALLPSGQVRWEAIDDRTARVLLSAEGQTVSAEVTFNSQDEIVEIMSHDMEFEKLAAGETREWHMRFADYKPFEGMLIPTEIRAEWEMAGGNTFEYARFALLSADFNKKGRLAPLPKVKKAEHGA